MPPQLLALSEGPSFLLDKPILLVGRHQECDIQLPSRKVSRRHCCIAQVHDYLVVRDLSSTNGIRINGVRVMEGALHTGDELTIGNYRYEIRWDSQPVVRVPAPADRDASRRPRPLATASDDDPLEACDEPVPLDDPEGLSPPSPPQRPPAFPGGMPPAGPKIDKPAPAHDKPPALILPENLNLAPSKSDLFPPPPPPSPAG
jgi:predicted component of type VI protein secretion system